jgi:hypothetical protein
MGDRGAAALFETIDQIFDPGHPALALLGRALAAAEAVEYSVLGTSVYEPVLIAPAGSASTVGAAQAETSFAATSSAICTALRAAPLRRLSLLTNIASPRPAGAPSSWRMRPT